MATSIVVCLQVTRYCLVFKLEIQKNIFPWTRQQGWFASKQKDTNFIPFWNKICMVIFWLYNFQLTFSLTFLPLPWQKCAIPGDIYLYSYFDLMIWQGLHNLCHKKSIVTVEFMITEKSSTKQGGKYFWILKYLLLLLLYGIR